MAALVPELIAWSRALLLSCIINASPILLDSELTNAKLALLSPSCRAVAILLAAFSKAGSRLLVPLIIRACLADFKVSAISLANACSSLFKPFTAGAEESMA